MYQVGTGDDDKVNQGPLPCTAFCKLLPLHILKLQTFFTWFTKEVTIG